MNANEGLTAGWVAPPVVRPDGEIDRAATNEHNVAPKLERGYDDRRRGP
jgi:hypothetical protein